jgi:hypothetical protein
MYLRSRQEIFLRLSRFHNQTQTSLLLRALCHHSICCGGDLKIIYIEGGFKRNIYVKILSKATNEANVDPKVW